jgi:ectoine hydroxylase-related dioxygenase (phytanoyl-CoA dioxygenase family)
MEPEKYRFLWSLNRDILDVNLREPIELMPKQGDVLFLHYLCAHAASVNAGSITRLALNHKW